MREYIAQRGIAHPRKNVRFFFMLNGSEKLNEYSTVQQVEYFDKYREMSRTNLITLDKSEFEVFKCLSNQAKVEIIKEMIFTDCNYEWLSILAESHDQRQMIFDVLIQNLRKENLWKAETILTLVVKKWDLNSWDITRDQASKLWDTSSLDAMIIAMKDCRYTKPMLQDIVDKKLWYVHGELLSWRKLEGDEWQFLLEISKNDLEWRETLLNYIERHGIPMSDVNWLEKKATEDETFGEVLKEVKVTLSSREERAILYRMSSTCNPKEWERRCAESFITIKTQKCLKRVELSVFYELGHTLEHEAMLHHLSDTRYEDEVKNKLSLILENELDRIQATPQYLQMIQNVPWMRKMFVKAKR